MVGLIKIDGLGTYFPAHPVVKTSSSDAESAGSIPGLGGKILRALQSKKWKRETEAI